MLPITPFMPERSRYEARAGVASYTETPFESKRLTTVQLIVLVASTVAVDKT